MDHVGFDSMVSGRIVNTWHTNLTVEFVNEEIRVNTEMPQHNPAIVCVLFITHLIGLVNVTYVLIESDSAFVVKY